MSDILRINMDAIDHLINHGVDTVYPSKEAFEKILRSGKKLRLYQGFDPTGTQLHIGHAVAFRKLREFQQLGHHVIFLIGDGTGQAGDPSGKKKTRDHFFTREELRQNAREYVMQAAKIVKFDGDNPVEILYNGDWLNKLGLVDILNIAGNFSVQQFLERDMYQERIKAGESINIREFMYPLLQGYDSVAMNVDLELGGTDQTFNMLVGRTLVERMLHKEKFVMTLPLLADSKGVKIGKSEGNVIGITDPPTDFYAKIMSLGDDSIIPCFTLLTDTPMEQIEEIKAKLMAGDNPMVYKKKLAFELTKQFNDEKSAEEGQKQFEVRVQKKDYFQADLPIISVKNISGSTLPDQMMTLGLASSKSEAKRLITQGSVSINDIQIKDHTQPITFTTGTVIVVGKKKAVRIGE